MDIPISPELLSRLNTLADFLGANILWQEEVISDVVCYLQPLFTGCTCPAGQLQCCLWDLQALAKLSFAISSPNTFFGPEKLLRLDMSEFTTKDSINIPRGEHTANCGLLGRDTSRSERQ